MTGSKPAVLPLGYVVLSYIFVKEISLDDILLAL